MPSYINLLDKMQRQAVNNKNGSIVNNVCVCEGKCKLARVNGIFKSSAGSRSRARQLRQALKLSFYPLTKFTFLLPYLHPTHRHSYRRTNLNSHFNSNNASQTHRRFALIDDIAVYILLFADCPFNHKTDLSLGFVRCAASLGRQNG